MQSWRSNTLHHRHQQWSLILKYTGSMCHVSASLTLSLTMKHVSDFTFLSTACQLGTAGVCINMSSLSPCLTLNTCCRMISLLSIPSVLLSNWGLHTNTHSGGCIHSHTCTFMPIPACIIPYWTWSSGHVFRSLVCVSEEATGPVYIWLLPA